MVTAKTEILDAVAIPAEVRNQRHVVLGHFPARAEIVELRVFGIAKADNVGAVKLLCLRKSDEIDNGDTVRVFEGHALCVRVEDYHCLVLDVVVLDLLLA